MVSAVTDQTEVPDAGQMQDTSDLDDDDGQGLSLNAQSRVSLMQKLDCSGTASSLTAVPTPWVAPLVQGGFPAVGGIFAGVNIPAVVDPVGVPSECLLLKNMFDPSTETEPEFDEDIKEDVKDKFSQFGELNRIFVDENSIGFVYLRFENAQAAMGAQRALHGRWFAGKMITATYMTKESYEAKFPESK
ncbi:hypothetical protein DY000_02005408 [Brassica cretica]|uniref:RRM domain-containing protein n=1 Tax=Brassica cretica TaxID=69181 RepID=A0ABQ7CCS4_BRACR|nr:hypothetical protein DY000_02005408 [Brassica cretica]